MLNVQRFGEPGSHTRGELVEEQRAPPSCLESQPDFQRKSGNDVPTSDSLVSRGGGGQTTKEWQRRTFISKHSAVPQRPYDQDVHRCRQLHIPAA
jgi:hypothetical protein